MGSGGRKSPSGDHPDGVWGQSPQKPENKRFMAFKKTICGDIWLVFMTINTQVCFMLLSYIPSPQLRNFLSPNFGGGAAAPSGYRNRRPLFIALSIIRYSKSAQKFAVRVCQVVTVVMATTQLVPSQFKNFTISIGN